MSQILTDAYPALYGALGRSEGPVEPLSVGQGKMCISFMQTASVSRCATSYCNEVIGKALARRWRGRGGPRRAGGVEVS
jgi:hypothetical protein